MNKTVKILQYLFWGLIALVAIIVTTFETDILIAGEMAGDKVTEYYWTVGLELTTIAILPMALRLMKLSSVSEAVKHSSKTYLRFALLRLSAIALTMLANAVLYYLFMQTTFGYLAIICLISMAFVYPSSSRCKSETSVEEP